MTKAIDEAAPPPRSRRLRSLSFFLLIALAVAEVSAAAEVITMPELVARSGGRAQELWKDVPSLQKAAEQGNPQAQLQLAELYDVGHYVQQDTARALQLYHQAAAAGEIDAKLRLAGFYHDGVGVEKDLTKAFEYYREAGLAGRGVGQFNVGAMLASGRGVPRDYVEGLAWLILATKSGVDEDGEQRLRQRLARRPEMIADAEKRAAVLETQIDKVEVIDATQAQDGRGPLVPVDPAAVARPTRATPPRPVGPAETSTAKPKAKAPRPPSIPLPTMRPQPAQKSSP